MENNIDKLFQNKLLQHQEKPSEQAWEKLEKAMYGKEIKRRSLGVYWQVAAAVALILVGSFFYSEGNKEENVAAKSEKTETKQPQVKEAEEELIADKSAKLAEVKIHQPIISLAKHKIGKDLKLQKTKEVTEALTAEVAHTVVLKQVEEVTTDVHQVAEIVEERIVMPHEDSDADEIRITVKFAEEIAPKQAKKSWLGKVVSSIKKKRQQEQDRENEGNTEKATFSVFGIDTEKVFAKRKMAE